MTERVTFQGKLSDSEIEVGLALAFSGSSRLIRQGMTLLLFAYGVWMAVARDSFLLLGVATLVLYVGVLIRQPLGHRFRETRRTDKRLSVPIHGVASNKGIEINGDGFSHFLPWAEYLYYKISTDMVVFHRAGSTLSLFPHAYFASDSDWQEFQQLVQRHVAEYPKGRYTAQPS